MTKTVYLACSAFLLALCVAPAPAQAQLARTFVSAEIGNDANDCNRLTPCRTFQGAHDKTLANGEITVLDAGGYGAVTITKSISIINDGVGEAGVLVSGALNGVTINAGASDAISLRGLTIKGLDAAFGGGNGIVFNSGKSLTIENCVLRSHTGGASRGNGILFFPTGSSSLAVSNTVMAGNSSSGIFLLSLGTGGTVKATFSRTELYNNGFSGLIVSGSADIGTIDVTVTDSVAANNGASGFGVVAHGTGATTRLMVIRSVSANNAVGLSSESANATLRVGQSTVTGNTTSWTVPDGGTLLSYGDNNIDGNGDANPAPPAIPKK